jgi:hypothetical protein
MKKSTVFLAISICLAICWSLIIGLMAASTLSNYMKGKHSSFARSDTEFLESKKKTFPAPVNELFISGEGTADLILVHGKELTVLAHPGVWAYNYTNLKKGEAIFSFKKLQDYANSVTIMVPDIPSISFDNFISVTVDGLQCRKITLQGNRLLSFTAHNCKIAALRLDFPGKKDQQEIFIEKSNLIDTLIASVKGFGNVRLETAGTRKNQLSLSESIKLEASMDLMKKLAIEPQSRVLNK